MIRRVDHFRSDVPNLLTEGVSFSVTFIKCRLIQPTTQKAYGLKVFRHISDCAVCDSHSRYDEVYVSFTFRTNPLQPMFY